MARLEGSLKKIFKLFRYGADIILRRRLESYIAEKQKINGGCGSVPVVCVVLEGGTCTVRTVLDYVTR